MWSKHLKNLKSLIFEEIHLPLINFPDVFSFTKTEEKIAVLFKQK